MTIEYCKFSYRSPNPFVTIGPRGHFIINKCLAEQIDFTKTPYCIVGFDKEENLLALRLIEKPEDGYRIFNKTSRGSITFCARLALTYFGIKFSQRMRVPAYLKDNKIIIDLSKSQQTKKNLIDISKMSKSLTE